MRVIKRNGTQEDISFSKIINRIQRLCDDLDFIDPTFLTKRASNGFYDGMSTEKIDQILMEVSLSMVMEHPTHITLATRISISKLHKETSSSFSDVMAKLYYGIEHKTGPTEALISKTYFDIVEKHGDKLDLAIKHERDYIFDYYGFQTLVQNYLLKINGKIVERPQHLFMRAAIVIHGNNIEKVIETYDFMSNHYFIHSSPTLLSACTVQKQMASCYVFPIIEDSIGGIYETLKHCALICHSAGRIGLSVSCARANGSIISTSSGKAKGLIPMLRVFNSTSLLSKSKSIQKSGQITVFVEPWHADIFEFLELKKSTGKEEIRARDLGYGLWIPDLFMKRVLENGTWSLMCPHESPGLIEVWGNEFENLYIRYEKEGKYRRQIQARDLWNTIISSQVETGMPCISYKDHCNRKSNQSNMGTIGCSSSCAEIVQYSSSQDIAVCSLASISVKKFVNSANKEFDFQHLKEVTKIVTKNLDNIIDVNGYPSTEAKSSAMKQRAIGIGIQGFADAVSLLRYPFESEEAQLLNLRIFETLYFGALEASCEIATEKGKYPLYDGSPISKGVLQYDMWNVTPTDLWDWAALKEKIAKYGVRNSLLTTSMSNASTAKIFGNNASTEPYSSNTLPIKAGQGYAVNPHLLKDLSEINMWNEDMEQEIITQNGSIQDIAQIPSELKLLYKTAWEISQKTVMKMAIDRGAFIDQSESLSIHMQEPTPEKITSMHFYAWKQGLKTGMYVLQAKPKIASPL